LALALEVKHGKLAIAVAYRGAALLRYVSDLRYTNPTVLEDGKPYLACDRGVGPGAGKPLLPFAQHRNRGRLLVFSRKVTKAIAFLRGLDSVFPLADVTVDQGLNVGFKLGTKPKTVLDDNLFDMFDATFDLVDPGSRSLQLVGCTNVVHQETVDVLDCRVLIDVGSEQVSMTGFCSTVPADVQVVAVFCGNQSKVLAL